MMIRLRFSFRRLNHYEKSSKKIENYSFPKEAIEGAARQNVYVLLVKKELGFSRVVVSKGIKMNFEQNYLWRVERVNELPLLVVVVLLLIFIQSVGAKHNLMLSHYTRVHRRNPHLPTKWLKSPLPYQSALTRHNYRNRYLRVEIALIRVQLSFPKLQWLTLAWYEMLFVIYWKNESFCLKFMQSRKNALCIT